MTEPVMVDNTVYLLAEQGSELNRALDVAYREGDGDRARLLYQAMQDNAVAREQAGPMPVPMPLLQEPPSGGTTTQEAIPVEDL